MASTFRGEGGKGSIKLLHHQNALGVFWFLTFISWNIQFSQIPPFLSRTQSWRSGICGLGSASFKHNFSFKAKTTKQRWFLLVSNSNLEARGKKVLRCCPLCLVLLYILPFLHSTVLNPTLFRSKEQVCTGNLDWEAPSTELGNKTSHSICMYFPACWADLKTETKKSHERIAPLAKCKCV